MIVNHTNEGWEVIYQKAHGLLAASIAQFWKKSERPERWLETLIAICEHDDNQENWHGSYHLTPQGAPQDFTLKAPDLEQANRITHSARVKSQWIGLLIACHMEYLYNPYSSEIPAFKKLLAEQYQYKNEILKYTKIHRDVLEKAYRLMNWCDRASLILCKNQIPPDGIAIEVARGPEVESYYLSKKIEHDFLTVDPWPFEADEFSVSVETRRLNKMVFKNDAALKRALDDAPIEIKEWRFKI